MRKDTNSSTNVKSSSKSGSKISTNSTWYENFVKTCYEYVYIYFTNFMK